MVKKKCPNNTFDQDYSFERYSCQPLNMQPSSAAMPEFARPLGNLFIVKNNMRGFGDRVEYF